jgi:hypothetical protein
MTLSPEQALYDRVLDFVSSETATRKQHLSGNTDIEKDLGVTGDAPFARWPNVNRNANAMVRPTPGRLDAET